MTTNAEYLLVSNEYAQIDGVLRSEPGRQSPTVLLDSHPRTISAWNLNSWPCLDLPPFGIDTFGFNNRFTNSPAGTEVVTTWEEYALDVAAAVAAMRDRGYKNVILYGLSAGGPLMSYYQNVAENGNSVFGNGQALSGFKGFFADDGKERRLPPADAVIFQNSTIGTGNSFIIRLDASILDEDEVARDPDLDLFNPANGYDPERREAHYKPEFLSRYYRAQAERMNRLIVSAQHRTARIKAGQGRFVDDDFMTVAGVRGIPAAIDMDVASTSRGTYRLYPSQDVTTIKSTRLPLRNSAVRNRCRHEGGTIHTLTSFLSYRAVAADSEHYNPFGTTMEETGIDYTSSNGTTPRNLAGITAPMLITVGTADTQVHIPSSELLYNSATSTRDKTVFYVDGAEHNMVEIDGKYGNTRKIAIQQVAEWIKQRFPVAS